MKNNVLVRNGAAIGLILLALAGYYFKKSSQHEIIYKVHGKAGSDFVVIRYLDTPAFGYFEGKQLKRVRVPASSLPWTTTVYLPTKANTFVSVSNEHGGKSALRIDVTIDGRKSRSWPGQDVEEFDRAGIIFPS